MSILDHDPRDFDPCCSCEYQKIKGFKATDIYDVLEGKNQKLKELILSLNSNFNILFPEKGFHYEKVETEHLFKEERPKECGYYKCRGQIWENGKCLDEYFSGVFYYSEISRNFNYGEKEKGYFFCCTVWIEESFIKIQNK